MKVGEFVLTTSIFCPTCGQTLVWSWEKNVGMLTHAAMPGQEFCPNWGKSFEAPAITLKEKIS